MYVCMYIRIVYTYVRLLYICLRVCVECLCIKTNAATGAGPTAALATASPGASPWPQHRQGHRSMWPRPLLVLHLSLRPLPRHQTGRGKRTTSAATTTEMATSNQPTGSRRRWLACITHTIAAPWTATAPRFRHLPTICVADDREPAPDPGPSAP